jgi:hypothetical protein
MLSRDEFQALFAADWLSAWRWECQGIYHEPNEQEPLRRFLAGESDNHSWYRWPDRVRAWVEEGRRIGRVRMLTEPLTDYLRFEISITPPALEAGEDIQFLGQERALELGAPVDDFWMFDDTIVVAMTFDDRGVSGAELITDSDAVRRYAEWKAVATREAVPYGALI